MEATEKGRICLVILCALSQHSALGQEVSAAAVTPTVPEPEPEWDAWQLPECTSGFVYSRTRSCRGGDCVGDLFELHPWDFPDRCENTPEPGKWGTWQKWSACSVSCAGGWRIRVRNCSLPESDSALCAGPGHKEESCNTEPCPVDGVYLDWSDWGPCSKTCGDAVRTRHRNCTQPQHGGEECSGEDIIQSELCDDIDCPGWKEWAPWAACNETCGSTGVKRRERECVMGNVTLPSLNCTGLDYQYYTCNRKHCPIDGSWGAWGQWRCSHRPCTTRPGVKQRVRQCNPPRHNGEWCEGDSYQRESCTNTCYRTVNGQWCSWGEETCHDTYTLRVRFCMCPKPQNGGKDCLRISYDPKKKYVEGIEEAKTNRTCGVGPGAGSGSGSGDGSNGDDDDNGENGSAQKPDD